MKYTSSAEVSTSCTFQQGQQEGGEGRAGAAVDAGRESEEKTGRGEERGEEKEWQQQGEEENVEKKEEVERSWKEEDREEIRKKRRGGGDKEQVFFFPPQERGHTHWLNGKLQILWWSPGFTRGSRGVNKGQPLQRYFLLLHRGDLISVSLGWILDRILD